ncbi:ImuA family protein [Ferrovibrio sp.]|uniref:ImuA family protein n=1 Tax=Ferrovibrio sp. TaxID=1917215 RepID=UPI003D0C4A1E
MTGDRNAIIGFLAALLGRDPRASDVLWVTQEPALPVHRLTRFGLDHRRLTIVSARRADDRSWSIEEGLGELGYETVVAEIDNTDLAETRRLQLAAEKSGGIGFLLCRGHQPSAALTRWRIEPARSDGYRSCWHLSLERCRNTATNLSWSVEWDDATLSFRLVSDRLSEQELAVA